MPPPVSLAKCTTLYNFPHARAPFLLAGRQIREIRRATGYEVSIEKLQRPEKEPPAPLANCTTVTDFPTEFALAVGGPAPRPTIRCRTLVRKRFREPRPGRFQGVEGEHRLFPKHSRGQRQAQIRALEGESVGIEIKNPAAPLKTF